MLSLVNRWFEPVEASQEYPRFDFIILLMLLAVGTWVRFWHLGNVGLHGDEDIMGLAARGVVAHGIPILPSDLVYWRAPLHTYLLAGSTLLFGDTEWGLRLPSAIVGSLCGFLAFLLGKRFLDPKANLAFVALVTFLPAMIEISQTARMYVFFVAGVLMFGILLFRWERQPTFVSFVWAFTALLVAIQFHQLAVFAAPLLLYPGLANASRKQLLHGAAGLVLAAAFSEGFGYFAHMDYPDESERLILEQEGSRSALELMLHAYSWVAILCFLALVGTVILLGTVGVRRWKELLPATIVLAGGVAACALLQYHIGGIALLFGSIIWLRIGTASNRRLLLVFVAIVIMALAQFYLLQGTGEFPGRKILGAFVGTPSIWPTLRFLAFSPAGAAVLLASIGLACFRLARGHKVPVHFLFFGLAVWVPLVAIGLFKWYTATRYLLGPLLFFLLSAVAGATYVLGSTAWGTRLRKQMPAAAVAGSLLVLAAINPAAAWQTAANSYDAYPDHKGAAEFIKGDAEGASGIIIAEDSIMQTYYLGTVDYRLQSVAGAKSHALLKDGVLYDQYTGAPVIGSGEAFQAVLRESADRPVYVISSAQVSDSLSLRNRGAGIADVLDSRQLEVVYTGRDRETTVWKLRP